MEQIELKEGAASIEGRAAATETGAAEDEAQEAGWRSFLRKWWWLIGLIALLILVFVSGEYRPMCPCLSIR